jgi:hypothetical protein
MNRRCGSCTLCCRLLPVRALAKPANQRCGHQFSGGCKVYHRIGFPRECAIWSCRWLVDSETQGLGRPDRTGYVIDLTPDLVRVTNADDTHDVICFQVWCDPARPEAWRDPALLRYAEAQAKTGEVMLVRFGTERAIAVVAPRINETGDWLVIDSGIVEHSITGSMLFDRIVHHRNREARDE